MHETDIHTRGGKTSLQVIGKQIVAHPADHISDNAFAQSPGRTSLVGSFPAGDHLEIRAESSFSERGKPGDAHHEIHIQTSENHDFGRHRCEGH